MKRFFALVLSVLMILSLCSFASAASSEITLHARDMNMNYLTGTFSVKDEGSDYYRIIDAAGNELMGTDRKYTSVYPSSSYPVFTVEVESADGIHDEGLVDGYGNVLVPAQYADVNIISNRWQAGILLTRRQGRLPEPLGIRRRQLHCLQCLSRRDQHGARAHILQQQDGKVSRDRRHFR